MSHAVTRSGVTCSTQAGRIAAETESARARWRVQTLASTRTAGDSAHAVWFTNLCQMIARLSSSTGQVRCAAEMQGTCLRRAHQHRPRRAPP